MEKLIELLNEYETPRSGVIYKSYDDYDGFFYGVDCDGETEIAWSDSLICSKKFGFIKWLVENEKIDLWSNTFTEIEEHYFGEQPDFTFQSVKYTHLLMLLSIQDNPIEFLVSILKNV